MLKTVESLMASVPEDVETSLVVRMECDYHGYKFTVQSQPTGYYVRDKTGWRFFKANADLRKKIKAITILRDSELAKAANDRKTNQKKSEDIRQLLTSAAKEVRGNVWIFDKTMVTLEESTFRFIIHHSPPGDNAAGCATTTSPLKPMNALNRLVNYEPEWFKLHHEEIDDSYIRRAVGRCLKSREERKEGIREIIAIFNKIGKKQRPAYRSSGRKVPIGWTIGKHCIPVAIDPYMFKVLVDGEWMVPFQALDKIGSKDPSIAKKLANPRLWSNPR